MKSIEVKFNEALAELKKKATAKKYDAVCKEYAKLPTIEAKLNCVEAALGLSESANPLKLEDIEEAKRDFAVLFGVEPRVAKEIVVPPIKKHNGISDNYGAPSHMTEATNTGRKTLSKGDVIIIENLTDPVTKQPITEAEKRKLLGKQPEGYEKLTDKQRKEFDSARFIGISEADAFRLAKMSGSNITEVSRR
jgi:hypothetical protein